MATPFVVGAPDYPNSVPGAGYVFVRSGDTWTEQAKLDDLLSNAGPRGWSVDVSGNTAILGGLHDDPTFTSYPFYVFARDGDDWALQVRLPTSGRATTLDGDTVIFGDLVYNRDGSAWAAAPSLPGEPPFSIALWGDTAVVGPASSGAETEPMVPAVYERTGDGWAKQADLQPSELPEDFSYDVAISGDTIVVGVWNGAAHVFVRVVCGDGKVDPGEACDGEACCTETCELARVVATRALAPETKHRTPTPATNATSRRAKVPAPAFRRVATRAAVVDRAKIHATIVED